MKAYLKAISLIALASFVCLFISSCSASKYSDGIDCYRISRSLCEKIGDPESFKEYSADDVKYIFTSPELFDSCSVLYSADPIDITEIGVLHAADPGKAHELLKDVQVHLEETRRERYEFLRSYSPDEISKLEGAQAKLFGSYVIFTVLEQGDTDKVMSAAQRALKEKDE